jgi:hypothetical protein
MGGVEDGDGRVVPAIDDQVPDRDALSPRDTDAGSLWVDGVVVDATVERVGHFCCVAEQQGFFTGRSVSPVGGQGVGGPGDLVAGMQSARGAVPVDRAAHRRGPPSRKAREAARSSRSRMRQTSESFCVHGRSSQS